MSDFNAVILGCLSQISVLGPFHSFILVFLKQNIGLLNDNPTNQQITFVTRMALPRVYCYKNGITKGVL